MSPNFQCYNTIMKKRLSIAFLMSPLEDWHPDDDTSLAIMTECRERGHSVFFFESQDLMVAGSSTCAELRAGEPDARRGFVARSAAWTDLASLDAIVIRKEPPFNENYSAAMHLLSRIEKRVYMMNRPSGVFAVNEKISVLDFARFSPKSAVVYTPRAAREAMKRLRLKQAVLKRTDQKGGEGILRTYLGDPSLDGKLRELESIHKPVVLQEFVPHEKNGDKRVLLLAGRPIGAFERVPGTKDFRANMARGGTARAARVTASDRKIASALSPLLKRRGLDFVGIDLLDGKLSEINVTSPAGIPEINRFDNVRLERVVVDHLENKAVSF